MKKEEEFYEQDTSKLESFFSALWELYEIDDAEVSLYEIQPNAKGYDDQTAAFVLWDETPSDGVLNFEIFYKNTFRMSKSDLRVLEVRLFNYLLFHGYPDNDDTRTLLIALHEWGHLKFNYLAYKNGFVKECEFLKDMTRKLLKTSMSGKTVMDLFDNECINILYTLDAQENQADNYAFMHFPTAYKHLKYKGLID